MTRSASTKNVARLFGAACIFFGIYYLLSEFSAIALCGSSYSAYIFNTISDLGVPTGNPWSGDLISFSPAYRVMNYALVAAGISIAFCNPVFFSFLIGENKFSQKKLALAATLAGLSAAGTATVGICHSDSPFPDVCFLHLAGAALSFICGNVLTLFASLFYDGEKFKKYARIGRLTGISGLIFGFAAAAAGIGFLKPAAGVFERLSVYPMVAWEIICGIYLLSRARID